MKSKPEEKDGDRSKKKEEEKSGIFASCSFSDLGLHPALCQHLQGLVLPRFLSSVRFNLNGIDALLLFLIVDRENGVWGSDTDPGASDSGCDFRPACVSFSIFIILVVCMN